MMQQKLYFRVDANKTIGRGHASRCMAAAYMLNEICEISFVCLNSNVSYIQSIVDKFEVIGIENDEALPLLVNDEDYLWLDGYNFTESWKKKMRPLVAKLIETNDIPYPVEHVDILVNHTPGLNKEMFTPYNPATVFCLGLDFALLRPKFLKTAQQQQPPKSLSGEGVFVCFGGADPYDLGEKFVTALMDANFTAPIYWVVKSASQLNTKPHPNVNTLFGLDESEMIAYMAMSRVVLIPASVLSFEAIALRKPIFTCYFVDNQQLINKGLLANNLAYGVGYIETMNDIDKTIKLFLTYYNDASLQKDQIKRQIEYLDGKSSRNIKEVMV